MSIRVTLRELAEMLNVSTSTVSKSLSGSPEIGEMTKQRVRQLANDMGYMPNYMALRLKRGRSMAVGVILPTVMNPYYAKMLSGIEEVLTQKGFKMVTLFTGDLRSREMNCLYRVMDGSVEGVIICMAKETQRSGLKNHFSDLNLKKLPKVLVDRPDDSIEADQVVSNDRESTQKACEQLIEKYLVKNLVFASLMGNIQNEDLRFEGFKAAMLDVGLDMGIRSIRTRDATELERTMLQLCDEGNMDGVFCANESTLRLVLNIFQDSRNKIKKIVPIIGFCGESIKTLSGYPFLTIIDQCPNLIGKKAAHLLCQRIELGNSNSFQKKTIKAKII